MLRIHQPVLSLLSPSSPPYSHVATPLHLIRGGSCVKTLVFVLRIVLYLTPFSSSAHTNQDELTRKDLVRFDWKRVREGYFPLQKSKDICFELGRVHMALKEYGTAQPVHCVRKRWTRDTERLNIFGSVFLPSRESITTVGPGRPL